MPKNRSLEGNNINTNIAIFNDISLINNNMDLDNSKTLVGIPYK